MTKSTEILDDDAIAEIEARRTKLLEQRPTLSWEVNPFNCLCDEACKPFMLQAPSDIDALCQTVRALKTEMKAWKTELLQLSGRGELLTKEHVNFDSIDPLVAVRNEFDRLRNIVIRDLQTQLEQVTKERDELKDNMARLGRARAREMERE